jgi:hypothetical protein
MRVILFLLTSLPVFLAGLGWGWQGAAISGLASIAFIGALGGPLAAAIFGVSQVLPAVILSYLALLSREVVPDDGRAPYSEWYPPGRLVFWSAVMAGLLTLAILSLASIDVETLKTSVRGYLTESIANTMPPREGKPPLDEEQISNLTDIIIAMMPSASAISWMTAMVFNLYLAGRIALAAGQLGRPWPDLSALSYPTGTGLMLIASGLACGAAGIAGGAGAAFLGAFFLAYVLLGLAVVHFVTRGKPWRPFALWSLYAGLLIVNVWIAVIIAIVGLAEGPLQLRRRAFPSGPPPPPAPAVST